MNTMKLRDDGDNELSWVLDREIWWMLCSELAENCKG